jgi:hypothetical protein
MTKMGDGAFTVKNADCPFCGDNKKKWGVFKHDNDQHYFKCHKPECPANNPAHGHGEVGYIALRRGLSVTEASKEYLRMAVPDLFQENDFSDLKVEPAKHEGFKRNSATTPTNVWHALWKKLPLTPIDRKKLKEQRGFSDQTIDNLGFRSNSPANHDLLLKLAQEWSVEKLLEEGIFVDDKRKGPRPSGQFCGYGITGKKDKDGKPLWEITEPIIIPYLDEDGTPFYLRPHKGGVSRPKDDLDDDKAILESIGEDVPCSSHVYCPFTISDLSAAFDGTCVLTEGEYKVNALYQCGIPALCIPGITFVRNPTFKRQLIELLRKYEVTDLVIMFDNEVKDDPSFRERYKADPKKRYETQVWAEYTAIDLKEHFRANGTVKISWLPNECLVNGKADFDGVLAKEVRDRGLIEGTAAARQIFRNAIAEASEKPPLDLFPSESRRIIEFRLKQLFHKPEMPAGGDKEAKLARRFSEYDPETNKPIDHDLAAAFRSVNECYFERESVKPSEYTRLTALKDDLLDRLTKHDSGVVELSREKLWYIRGQLAAVYERLKGIPNPISDFLLLCEYKRYGADGSATRLVRIKNKNDKTYSGDLYPIEARNIAGLRDFREWGYATGKAAWQGSEKDLQCLVKDMDQHSYLSDISEVDLYGYHNESGIWFFGDAAWDKECKRIEADANNIFWHMGGGYQIDPSIAKRGSSFGQKAPMLLQGKPTLDIEEVRKIYAQFLQDMFDTIGSYEGWLALGIILAYGFAPELLKTEGGHPGLWMYGKMSGGKTTVARWLMRIWGFPELHGTSIGEGTTPVAVTRYLGQYSCLPFWFDEFRRDQVDAAKVSMIRYAFDRGGTGKGIATNDKRTRMAVGLTTPLITGETGSTDAATRSRYIQVQISKNNRIGDSRHRYDRVQSECKHLFQIGRYIMEHRKEFQASAMETVHTWMNNDEVKKAISNERLRFIHGVAYAAIDAMDNLLSTKEQRLPAYLEFIKVYGNQSLEDVMEETFLNTFWRDIANGLQTGKIKKRFLTVERVSTSNEGLLKPDDESTRGRWVLYIAPAVFNEYSADKRSRNENVPLDVNSVQRELSKEPYWIHFPKAKPRTHRKTIDGTSYNSCWVLSLEEKDGRTAFPFLEHIVPHIARPEDLHCMANLDIISKDLCP